MTAPPPARVLECEGAPTAPAVVTVPGRAHRPGHARRPGRAHRPERGCRPGLMPGGGRLPRDLAMAAAGVARREWVAAMFGGSAVFAAVTALTSSNAPERLWGGCAAAAYSVAAVTAAMARRRGVSLTVLISLTGALAVPLAWMAVARIAQPEVDVVIRSAAMLVHHGTPYASPAALAGAHTWRAYDPYLPALIVFGLPRVFGGGPLTDPRLWFGLAFVAGFGAAVRVAGVPRPVWWTMLVTASPVVALPLATGGDDLPVLGLMCLGLALAGRASEGRASAGRASGRRASGRRASGRRWHWAAAAGLALGLAAAMKATAWPALAVVAALLAARQGWRAVCLFAAAVLGTGLIIDGPTVAAHPAAAMANTVLYPLGLTKTVSPAASMLPGHMLAAAGGWGHWTALGLLLLAGAGIGAWLVMRPSADSRAAGWRLVLGLALLFVLAPASRVGYFVYPLGVGAWLLLGRCPALPGDESVDPEPQYRRHAVRVHH